MSKTAIKFSTTDDSYEEFVIECDSADADRIKNLLHTALSDYRMASHTRKRESAHRVQVNAQRDRTAERNRLRHALKRAGIVVRTADDSYRSGRAELQPTQSYSTETTNGWLRLRAGSSYSTVSMIAKLKQQFEVEWELREESAHYSDTKELVLFVQLAPTKETNS